MKRSLSILLIALILIACSKASAQDKPAGKNELTAGFGLLPLQEMVVDLLEIEKSIFINIIDFDSVLKSDFRFYPTLEMGYQRSLGKVVAIGVNASLSSFSSQYTFDNLTSARSSYLVLTLMPSVTFTYVQTRLVSVYSGAAFGASLWVTNWDFSPDNSFNFHDSQISIAFHVNGMGVRIGKEVAGFAEVGFGFLGAIRAGISVKL